MPKLCVPLTVPRRPLFGPQRCQNPLKWGSAAIPVPMSKLVAILLAAGLLAGCAKEFDGPPNIILVTVDTLRWDYLSTYGFRDAGHTPAADRLADHGTVFTQAVATAGTTIPSHGSMLTGVYARIHGARSNFHGKYEGIGTVTEALQSAGYRTGAFVSNQFLFTIGDLGGGFEADNVPFQEGRGSSRPQSGDKTVAQASAWIDGLKPAQPAFLWLHLWEPHGPYDPTDWSRERMQDYDGILKDGMTADLMHNKALEIAKSPEDVQAMRTLYAGEVNLADQYLGQFLDHLEAGGRLDNTVVIFTADHGQTLGEGGRHGHGPNHRETVIRVPLIVADFRRRQPSRSYLRVGTIDVAPTIAAAASLEQAFDYAGRSLLNLGDLADDWPYFAEVAIRKSTDGNWERTRELKNYDAEALAVYSGPFKMTFKHGQYSLFETDIRRNKANKLELTEEAVMSDYLQGLLVSFQEIELDMSEGEVSEEDLKILQSLGYIQ